MRTRKAPTSLHSSACRLSIGLGRPAQGAEHGVARALRQRRFVVRTAITILVPYLVFAAVRYLKVRFDEAARSTLDTGMRNGADWVIREGRLPTPKEVLEYVQRAAPDAVARWELDRANRDLAESRAQAAIERALQAANGATAVDRRKPGEAPGPCE
jgi:hypothetical protein